MSFRNKNVKRIFKAVLFSVILVIMLAAAVYAAELADRRASAPDSSANVMADKRVTVIIDAGHGGMDGGAIGVSGALEKDINLLLSKRLFELLGEKGFSVIMTRSEDVMLEDNGKKGKSADLRARLRLCEQTENCVLVSIHMNKFSDPSVRGMTLYYSPYDPMSERIALAMKEEFSKTVKESGNRPMKAADSAIYLLSRATFPAVLVECGFISNELDEALLLTKEHRENICIAILNALSSQLSDG